MDSFVKEFILGLPLGNHRTHDRMFPNSFSGKEAIDWMIQQGFAKDRIQATIIGNNLMKSNYFTHVTNEHAFVDSEFLFYVYTPKVNLANAVEIEKKKVVQENLNEKNKRQPLTYAELEEYGLKFGPFAAEDAESEKEEVPTVSTNDNSEKINSKSFSVTNLPLPRMGHSAVVYDRKMWVYGGKGTKNNFNDLLVLSFDRNQWMKPFAAIGNTPAQRRSHNCIVYKDQMLLIGGYIAQKLLMDVFSYDFATRTWTFLRNDNSPQPEPRYLPSITLVNDCLYMLGGQDSKNINDFWKFDLNTYMWTELPNPSSLVSKRWGHSAVLYKSSLFIFGGINRENIYFKELYEYPFALSKFIRIIQPVSTPEARYGHQAVVIGKEMYIYGGIGSNGYLGDFHKYNFETKTWSPLPSDGPGARSFFSMVNYGNFIYIFGGNSPQGFVNSTYKFALDTSQWILVENESGALTATIYHVLPQNNVLPKEFECTIHKGLIKDPQIVACGCRFCNECILNLSKCPNCNGNIYPINADIELSQKLRDFPIHCKYGCKKEDGKLVRDPEGCPELVTLRTQFDHEQVCKFKWVSCPNSNACGLVRAGSLEAHLLECTHSRCPQYEFGCVWVGTYPELEEHKKQCPYEQVSWALSRFKQQLLAAEEQVKILMTELVKSERELAKLKREKEKGSPISSSPSNNNESEASSEDEMKEPPNDERRSRRETMKKKLTWIFKSM